MFGSLDGIAVVMLARPVMGASWDAATPDACYRVRIVSPYQGLGRLCVLERDLQRSISIIWD